jgi:hydroxymethylpyrimidine pyrophosphatase-like HAD family hydrolase
LKITNSIIAIDYDGTITEKDSSYPHAGIIREDAKRVIKKLKEQGNTLCLWTCRSYKNGTLQIAQDALEKEGIEFDYYNEAPFTTGSPKIVADWYIDDRMLGGTINWEWIERQLCKDKDDDKTGSK